MIQASVPGKRQNIRIPSSRPVVLIINDHNIYATMTDFLSMALDLFQPYPSTLRIESKFTSPLLRATQEMM
jgi:ABC-type thiamine transport system ATPase subunit